MSKADRGTALSAAGGHSWLSSPVYRRCDEHRHPACCERFCEGSAAKPACRTQGSLLPFSASAASLR